MKLGHNGPRIETVALVVVCTALLALGVVATVMWMQS